MCNHYALDATQDEIAEAFGIKVDRAGNLPEAPDLFPDYAGPVIRLGTEGRELVKARWGMPAPKKVLLDAATKRADKLRAKGKEVDFAQLLRMEPDKGVTNIRNTPSSHWRRWLGPENRCVVPFTSFCEPDQASGSLESIWFALSEDRPLTCFAGIWTPWTCVRKVKEGEITCDLYGFLTTDANDLVKAYHPKAMPVILTTAEEIERWLTAPTAEALQLQRPLPDGALQLVARGVATDRRPAA